MSVVIKKTNFIRYLKTQYNNLGNSFIAGAGNIPTKIEDLAVELKYKKNKNYFDSVDLSIINAFTKLQAFIDYIKDIPAEKLFKE